MKISRITVLIIVAIIPQMISGYYNYFKERPCIAGYYW